MSKFRPSRRRFVQGAATSAAIAPFFIGKPARAADEPEFVLKFATVAPSGTTWANTAKKFKKYVAEKTEGRIKVKTYLGGGLGGEIETAESTKRGSTQGWGGSMGALASAVPEVEAFELPYLFKDTKQAQATLQAVRQQTHDLLWDRGYKLAFFSQNGFRSIGSTKPVESVKDLKGMKMRSLQNNVHLDTWRAMGASPVPMSVTEVLSSLQTGVIDGWDNTELFAFAAAWYVATTHFVRTKHIYQPAAIVYSRKWFESLPKDMQEVLHGDQDTLIKMENRSFRSVDAMEGQLVQNFKDAGINVLELDDDARNKFRAATAGVAGKFKSRTSKAGKDLLKAIEKAT
jgi:TRAP-type C4-dicarboxylate transport system substrate-binding protein